MISRFIKNNLKIIIAVGLTVIICISGTVLAAFQYNAKQIEYKDGKSVEEALNELYTRNESDVILSINQYISLTTAATSTTIPRYYNNRILSYDSTRNIYEFLEDFDGTLYIVQGWIQGVTASKLKIDVNNTQIVYRDFGNNISAEIKFYQFKKGDILKIYSKFDCSSTKSVPIAIDLIKN